MALPIITPFHMCFALNSKRYFDTIFGHSSWEYFFSFLDQTLTEPTGIPAGADHWSVPWVVKKNNDFLLLIDEDAILQGCTLFPFPA